MPTSYGQFGTPGYFGKDVPPGIVANFPGTQNIQQGLGMFGDLLYGPYSNAYQITAAQAADPTAQAFQGPSGGAFANPAVGPQALGSLFSSQMGANVAGQQAKQKQQIDAAKGMLTGAQDYASNIYNTLSAGYGLQKTKAQQQAQEQQGVMGLINLFTNPESMLSNILGPGGAGKLGPGQSAFGGLFSALMGGGGGAMTPFAALSATTPGLATSGLGAGDIGGAITSLAEYAPELAPFAIGA